MISTTGVGVVYVDGGGRNGERRVPIFHENRFSLGALAGSILSPSLLTNAAPELASTELRCIFESTEPRLLGRESLPLAGFKLRGVLDWSDAGA